MGYYQRRIGFEAFRAIAIIVALALISAWPCMLGTYIATRNGAAKNSTAYNVAGWIPEIAWIALVLVGGGALIHRSNARARRKAAAAVQQRMDVARFRMRMAQSNQPWFDAERGHFSHSTCAIKRRSVGAAARCSGRI